MSKAILSATIALAVGSLFIAGCATKNYVKQSIQPVDQKIDQVDKSSQTRDSSQVADINKTNQVVDEDEKKLSATDEVAKTADGTAKGAMAKLPHNSSKSPATHLSCRVRFVRDASALGQSRLSA